jgi:HPt (histidine-containing phosphotransfer) domain-containing protein
MPKIFDVDALIEELELDHEDIAELLTDFREFLSDTLPKLANAVQSGDLAESRSLSHSIKGSAGNLRVSQVYETAKKMQDMADEQNLDGLKELLPQIEAETQAFLTESENFS